MKISKERLLLESATTNFRPEILEKVWNLMFLLDGINSHPFLKSRFALKGGTALNLFVFDLPRLSVDIDFNYIGTSDRNLMLEERSKVEQALEAVFQREDFIVCRIPGKHAGGKLQLRYQSVLGYNGNLEVDLNYMFRTPLWKVQKKTSCLVGNTSTKKVAILDLHELAAGKLAALFSRKASRDLFDVHHLLTKIQLDKEKLRLAFILYGAMSSIDWRNISVNNISFDDKELRQQLIPVLSMRHIAGRLSHFATNLVVESKDALSILLPFRQNEIDFLNNLYEQGNVVTELLTDEKEMQSIIDSHPLLKWKASLAKMK